MMSSKITHKQVAEQVAFIHLGLLIATTTEIKAMNLREIKIWSKWERLEGRRKMIF